MHVCARRRSYQQLQLWASCWKYDLNHKQLVDQIKIQETTDCALQGTNDDVDDEKSELFIVELSRTLVWKFSFFTACYFPKAIRQMLALEIVFRQRAKNKEFVKSHNGPMNKSWSFSFFAISSFDDWAKQNKQKKRSRRTLCRPRNEAEPS